MKKPFQLLPPWLFLQWVARGNWTAFFYCWPHGEDGDTVGKMQRATIVIAWLRSFIPGRSVILPALAVPPEFQLNRVVFALYTCMAAFPLYNILRIYGWSFGIDDGQTIRTAIYGLLSLFGFICSFYPATRLRYIMFVLGILIPACFIFTAGYEFRTRSWLFGASLSIAWLGLPFGLSLSLLRGRKTGQCHLKMKQFKHLLLSQAVVALIYILCYMLTSINGRFEPYFIGLNGVKRYAWAPKGFVKGYRWNATMEFCFLPLWLADNEYWHTEEGGANGKYPVDEVEQVDIWKVYKAWQK